MADPVNPNPQLTQPEIDAIYRVAIRYQETGTIGDNAVKQVNKLQETIDKANQRINLLSINFGKLERVTVTGARAILGSLEKVSSATEKWNKTISILAKSTQAVFTGMLADVLRVEAGFKRFGSAINDYIVDPLDKLIKSNEALTDFAINLGSAGNAFKSIQSAFEGLKNTSGPVLMSMKDIAVTMDSLANKSYLGKILAGKGEVQTALTQLQNQIGKAIGANKSQGLMKQLLGEIPEDQLVNIVEILNKFKESGFKNIGEISAALKARGAGRTALTFEGIFGGGVGEDPLVKAQASWENTMKIFTQAWDNFKTRIQTSLAPILAKLAEKFSDITPKLEEISIIVTNKISDGILKVVDNFDKIQNSLKSVWEWIKKIGDFFLNTWTGNILLGYAALRRYVPLLGEISTALAKMGAKAVWQGGGRAFAGSAAKGAASIGVRGIGLLGGMGGLIGGAAALGAGLAYGIDKFRDKEGMGAYGWYQRAQEAEEQNKENDRKLATLKAQRLERIAKEKKAQEALAAQFKETAKNALQSADALGQWQLVSQKMLAERGGLTALNNELGVFSDMLARIGSRVSIGGRSVLGLFAGQVNEARLFVELKRREAEEILRARQALLDSVKDEKEKVKYREQIAETTTYIRDLTMQEQTILEKTIEPVKFQTELQSKQVEQSKIILETSKAMYGTASLSMQASLNVVENLQRQKDLVMERLRLLEQEPRWYKETNQWQKDYLENQNEALRLTKDQIDTTKELRDGYLDAVRAQVTAAGRFSKIIIDQDRNLQAAEEANMRRRSYFLGFGGRPSGAAPYAYGAKYGTLTNITTGSNISMMEANRGRLESFFGPGAAASGALANVIGGVGGLQQTMQTLDKYTRYITPLAGAGAVYGSAAGQQEIGRQIQQNLRSSPSGVRPTSTGGSFESKMRNVSDILVSMAKEVDGLATESYSPRDRAPMIGQR